MSVQASQRKSLFALALEDAGFRGHRGRAEFGVKVGVDAVTVWRWATGRSRPVSQATRAAIAKALRQTDEAVQAMFADDVPDVAA